MRMRGWYQETRAVTHLRTVRKAGIVPAKGNRSLRNAASQGVEIQTSNNVAGSFRNRKGAFRPLPLPPLLDPVKIAAKERYRQPKACFPTQGWTPFQEKLRQNPYAEALASPVRACGVTGVRLPSFFHIDYNVIEHPETKKLWVLPNLSSTKPGHEGSVYPKAQRKVVQRSEHILARRPLLRFVSTRSRWEKILSVATKEKLKGKVKHLIWRQDMEDFVLCMLRQAVMTKLKWLFDHPGTALIVKIPNVAERNAASDDISCVLVSASFETDMVRKAQTTLQVAQNEIEWIARRLNRLARESSSSNMDGQHQLPLMPAAQAVAIPMPVLLTTFYHNHNVPVYSLPDVLGSENSTKLLEAGSFSDGLIFGIRSSKQTLGAQMALMKLQCYLAENSV